jgi:hypothetical protein
MREAMNTYNNHHVMRVATSLMNIIERTETSITVTHSMITILRSSIKVSFSLLLIVRV